MNGKEKGPAPLQILAYNKVLFYLRVLKKKIVKKEDDKLRIFVKETPIYRPEEEITVGIIIMGNWIRIFLVLHDDFTLERFGNKTADILFALLRMQEDFMEFSFGISKTNELLIKEDIYIKALTLDVFEEEYNAILEAYKKFKEKVLPKIKKGDFENWEDLVEVI